MYFPYFRGRQYELLALKELASQDLISKSVIPVVEPIKVIPALKNSLLMFQRKNLPLALILNPAVGDLVDEYETIWDASSTLLHNLRKSSVFSAIIMNESSEDAMDWARGKGIKSSETLVILNSEKYLENYESLFNDSINLALPKYTLCPYDRYIRRKVKKNNVLFEDKFNKQDRNADYPEEEEFSRDHIDYKEDGYIGFGDYSIIGKEYVESGFAPYAVAIHIVYFAEDDSLRIKHFVSDTNSDISNVAGKFYEAVEKLYKWYTGEHQERQLTTGLQVLLDHYKNKTYPGLPTLKKLSIMHHLELMGRYLDGRLGK